MTDRPDPLSSVVSHPRSHHHTQEPQVQGHGHPLVARGPPKFILKDQKGAWLKQAPQAPTFYTKLIFRVFKPFLNELKFTDFYIVSYFIFTNLTKLLV